MICYERRRHVCRGRPMCRPGFQANTGVLTHLSLWKREIERDFTWGCGGFLQTISGIHPSLQALESNIDIMTVKEISDIILW